MSDKEIREEVNNDDATEATETPSNPASELVDLVLSGELHAANEKFNGIVEGKVVAAIEDEKLKIAQTLFAEEDDEEEEGDDDSDDGDDKPKKGKVPPQFEKESKKVKEEDDEEEGDDDSDDDSDDGDKPKKGKVPPQFAKEAKSKVKEDDDDSDDEDDDEEEDKGEDKPAPPSDKKDDDSDSDSDDDSDSGDEAKPKKGKVPPQFMKKEAKQKKESFMGAVADAASKGEDEVEIGGKIHKVTMKDKTHKSIKKGKKDNGTFGKDTTKKGKKDTTEHRGISKSKSFDPGQPSINAELPAGSFVSQVASYLSGNRK